MNQHSSIKSGSLLERAAELYGFGAGFPPPGPASPPLPANEEAEAPFAAEPEQVETEAQRPRRKKKPVFVRGTDDGDAAVAGRPAPTHSRRGTIDREGLREDGFILPDAPVSGIAEEFRIVKRQLLQAASGKTGIAQDKRQTILVCSAAPNEGKTFCAINLALSMASEKDVEVLLVDGDFSKPEILSILGLEGGQGLTDAIAEPDADPENYVIQTNVERLSVLPAGSQCNNVTELLASQRTRQVFDALTAGRPNRIVIFDSPPVLMASPASILANKVGQIVMVVRADKTKETDLREAVGLISGCEHLSLMLNGTGFAPSGRRFGSYYGYGQ
jgi:exopolysaccharide/PEP-CTERM locus tyrosine autokinase